MEAHGLTDPIETPYCGGEISVSRDELWNTGIEVGPSLYGVKVYKNHSTVKTVSMNKTWGEKNKKIKVKLMKHGIAAQARIYEEKRWDFEDEAWVHEVFSPLYVENQVDKTAVVWIDSYSWQEWQKCCDEVDL